MPCWTQYATTPLRMLSSLPHTQFHLDRRDVDDPPGLLDLTDRDVAEADRTDGPSRFNAASARTLVESGVRGSGAWSW